MTTPNFLDTLSQGITLDDVAPVFTPQFASNEYDPNGLPLTPVGFDNPTGLLSAPLDVQAIAMSLLVQRMEPALVTAGEWLTSEGVSEVQQETALVMACAAGLGQQYGTWLTYRTSFKRPEKDKPVPTFVDLAVLQLKDGSCVGFRPGLGGKGLRVSIYRRVSDVIEGTNRELEAKPPVWQINLPNTDLALFGRKVMQVAGKAWVQSEWMR